MKINIFEEICNEQGGYYEYEITDDNLYMFVTLRTCKHAIFPDDLEKLKRRVKRRGGFKLQYISYKSDGIGLEFIKSAKE